MALKAGTRLGPYEVLSLLGAGGMGEVYKAHDTRLDRIVALKTLRAHLADNPDVKERFEREARTVASLQHEHICVLYDIRRDAPVPPPTSQSSSAQPRSSAPQSAIDYLVLEYLEGETLATHLLKGPLPLAQVLQFASEISDALDKAHRKTITHRDIKPGNIMLVKKGSGYSTKLLDFGLAKLKQVASKEAALPPLGPEDPTPQVGSPLLGKPARRATIVGTIMGTWQYMSPEQAEGNTEDIDGCADIFSFGAVIYEMVTGARAFEGTSTASVIAKVLQYDPPPMSTLVPLTPPALDRVVKACLAKDRDERLQTAHDLWLQLNWIGAEGAEERRTTVAVPETRKTRERLLAAAAAVFLISTALLSWMHFRPAPPAQQRSVRFLLPPPEKSVVNFFKLSPDGRYLAFTAQKDGRTLLWVRPLDSLEAQPLPGTEDASYPFWSPDSVFLGFFTPGKLKKIASTGGPTQVICDAGSGRGAAWNRDGVIVFSPEPAGPLFRVSAAGGVAVPVSKRQAGYPERYPEFLPDGRRFLYAVIAGGLMGVSSGDSDTQGIYVGSLDGTPPVRLLPDVSNAMYVPPEASGRSGHLLFRRGTTLMAQSFDPNHLKANGETFPLAEQVGITVNFSGSPGSVAFSASENGGLAYSSGTGATRELNWVDRQGKQLKLAAPVGGYNNFRLAADEKTIVMDRVDPQSSNSDIWVLDTVRGVTSRLTFDPALENLAIWSPDGLRVLFPSNRNGSFDLYIKPATGAGQEELLVKMGTPTGWGTDWSRDGRFILYQIPDPKTGQNLWIAPQFGDKKPFPYLQTQFNEQEGRFSPDGRWVAYYSDESGRDEVYVQAFPASGAKWQISTAGGSEPQWRKDGTELYYLAADRNLMAVPVKPGATFETGVPKPLFPVATSAGRRSYAVTGDAQRFLVSKTVGETATPITVVLNWTAGMKKQ